MLIVSRMLSFTYQVEDLERLTGELCLGPSIYPSSLFLAPPVNLARGLRQCQGSNTGWGGGKQLLYCFVSRGILWGEVVISNSHMLP